MYRELRTDDSVVPYTKVASKSQRLLGSKTQKIYKDSSLP